MENEARTLKKEIAQACAVLRLYNCKCKSVNDAYAKPSHRKQSIELGIQREMDKLNGWGYRVISHNCNFFTCGYFYETIDNETGEILYHMVIETPTKHSDIEITRFLDVEPCYNYGTVWYNYKPNQYCIDVADQLCNGN